MPESPKPVDERFQYQNISRDTVSVEMWDRIGKSVFDGTGGWLGLIKGLVMASFATIWIAVREKLVSNQMELSKQQYERGEAGQNRDDLNRDDLSSEKKP